jgi:subtilisin family serine protease
MFVVAALTLIAVPQAWAARPVSLGYSTPSALHGLRVIERIAPLRVAEVLTSNPAALRSRAGVRWVSTLARRTHQGTVSASISQGAAVADEWEFAATRSNLVPDAIVHAAAAITIAVVDTGADVSAPDLATKSPLTYNVITGDTVLNDAIGHGTFVASLAAGSISNGQGMVGFGGDARLMIVQANRSANTFTDVDEAAGIVWAVDHGAKIVNLSIGGTQTSPTERDAINYAIAHGVLLVAAAGNDGANGNPPSYPAALLGSHGLAVAASDPAGAHASFSTSAAYVSIAAPGVRVLGATTATSSTSVYPRVALPGDTGTYAYATGTSYSAPQVAGAAALVWAANPSLTADGVVQILEQSAAGNGSWNPDLGWGLLDVAAAVTRAGTASPPPALQPVKAASTPVARKTKPPRAKHALPKTRKLG